MSVGERTVSARIGVDLVPSSATVPSLSIPIVRASFNTSTNSASICGTKPYESSQWW